MRRIDADLVSSQKLMEVFAKNAKTTGMKGGNLI